MGKVRETEPPPVPVYRDLYNVGDVVSYNGKTYVCRMAHTALDGWQPSNVPALWNVQNGANPNPNPNPNPKPDPKPDTKPQPGDTWDANKVYVGGNTVIYNGQKFSAKWWTQGDKPDASNIWGVWKPVK